MGKSRPRGKGRMRRSYLKAFSAGVVSTGQGPSKEAIKEYAERAWSIGRQLPVTLGLPKPNNKDVSRSQVAKREREQMVTMQRMREMIGNDCKYERNVVIVKNKSRSVRLFFNSDCTLWFLMETDLILYRVRKSITYPTRERALQVFHAGQIRWQAQFLQLDPSEVNNPPPSST